jgi:hypothetical protein
MEKSAENATKQMMVKSYLLPKFRYSIVIETQLLHPQ